MVSKILKKICLPASLVAMATPMLLTSCFGEKMIEMNIPDFDPTSIDQPTVTLDDVKSITSSRYYGNKVVEDPNVLINDIFNAEYENYESGTSDFETYKVSLSSNIKVGNISYTLGGYHYSWPTFSFTYSWQTKTKVNLPDNKKSAYNEYTSNATVTYNNVPIVVSGDPIDHDKWLLESFPISEEYAQHLIFLKGWSVTSNVDYCETTYQLNDDNEIYGTLLAKIKDEFVIDSFYEIKQIESLINEVYPDYSKIFFKLFTGFFSFNPLSMTNVHGPQ